MSEQTSNRLTYAQARKEVRRVGASHAQGDALQSMSADVLAIMFAMRAEAIYKWGVRHSVDLWIAIRHLQPPIDHIEFVSAVLNDEPLHMLDAEEDE